MKKTPLVLFLVLFTGGILSEIAFGYSSASADIKIATTATSTPTASYTPTPNFTITPTPTFTPTATPVLDIEVHDVAILSKLVINTNPDLRRIVGSYSVDIVNNQPGQIKDTTVALEIRNVTGSLYLSKTEVISAEILLNGLPILFQVDVPASPGLPLIDYTAIVHVDPDETYEELDVSNNIAKSNLQFIAHISGNVLFGNIETQLIYNASSQVTPGSPMKLDGDGMINGSISITYTNLPITRDPVDLDLIVGPSITLFAVPDPFQPGDWNYTYTNGLLSASGAYANVWVHLPSSCNYQDAPWGLTYQNEPIALGLLQLDQDLAPVGEKVLSTVRRFYFEGIPFYMGSSGQTFSEAAGFLIHDPTKEYIHQERLLAFGAIRPGVYRESNDYFFGWAASYTTDVYIRHDGLEASLQGDPGIHFPSWPLRFIFFYNNYFVHIQAGEIQATSSVMHPAIAFQSTQNTSSCPDDPSFPSPEVKNFLTVPSEIHIGSEGQLWAHQVYSVTDSYDFNFNTYSIEGLTDFRFYQPGYITPLDDAPDPKYPVDHYLLAALSEDGSSIYPYGTSEALTGEGLFAGLNLLREDLTGQPFTVEIDANPAPLDLTMNEYSKIYIRKGGFSGIIDAGSLEPPATLQLYPDPCGKSYDVTLTAYGQAFLDNDADGWDSRMDGLIEIPWPSNIDIVFEKMLLNGCGNFEGGEIPDEEQDKTKNLAYWNADLKLQTLEFRKRDPLGSDDDRTLWVSSVNTIDHLSIKPVMQLNINACGDIPESNIREEISATFDDYQQSIQEIYLCKWDGNPSSPNGFYNIISETHFPFFGSSETHGLVKSTVANIADGGPYFDVVDPDLDNNGFPDSVSPSGGTIDEKIADYADTELVRVDKKFAGLIQLEYDVKYNNFDQRFKSKENLEKDLIVIDVESEVSSLDQEHAEIRFGATYSGLHLSSFSDDFSSLVEGTFLEPVRDQLDVLNGYLGGDLSSYLRDPLKSAIDAQVDQFVDDIQGLVAGVPDADVMSVINANFAGGDSKLDELLAGLDFKNYLKSSGNPAQDVLNSVFDEFDTTKDAMKIDPSDLDSLVKGVADSFLDQFGVSTNLNINDDKYQQPVKDAQDKVEEKISGEIEPKLQTAKNTLKPSTLLPEIFKSTEVDKINIAIDQNLKAFVPNLTKDELLNLDKEEIKNAILSDLFNSDAFMNLNTQVTNTLYPIKDELLGQAVGLLDKVNEVGKDYLDDAAGAVSSVEKNFNDVIGIRAASLEGYAVISYETLEKLHINGALKLAIPDDMEFKGFLDMTRYQINNEGENCFASLPGEELLDIKVGAVDVDLGWTGQDLKADITFGLMLMDLKLANISGSIVTKGEMSFEAVKFKDLGFGIAVGAIENYIWAMGEAQFNKYKMWGGLYLGTSCTLVPLQIIDPDVASFLAITEMRGVYAGVGGSFPIYDYGCFFRVGVEAGVKAWYFADGPTYGGLIRGGFYGKAACIVSAKGVIEIGAGKNAGQYYFTGNAWIAGGIGFCDPEDWHKPADVWKDKWCYTCVAYLDLLYQSSGGWDVDYDIDCE